MYEKELVPQIMAMGVSYDEFWTLNPRKINVIVEGHKLKRQVIDEQQWMLGDYVFSAVSIALGNAFRKKGVQPKEYFKEISQPITKRITDVPDENGLTEAEKRQKTELLFKNLEIMAANHRLNKGK